MRYDVTASCSERRKKNYAIFLFTFRNYFSKFVLVKFDFECNFRAI